MKNNGKNIIIVVLMMMILSNKMAYGNEIIPEKMVLAYEEIIKYNEEWASIPIESFDINVYNNYGILAIVPYGKISAVNGEDNNNYNKEIGEYRYIGYSPYGDLINNPLYPEDYAGHTLINLYDWQKNKKEINELTKYYTEKGTEEWYKNEISLFLQNEYGARFDPSDIDLWIERAIVIVPPTENSNGVIKFLHKWDSNGDGILEDWYITVSLRKTTEVIIESESDDPDTPIIGSIDITTTTVTYSDLDPSATGVIKADEKGAEKYQTSVAIPSGESLYVDIFAKDYLHEETYTNVQGTKEYIVQIKKMYTLRKWNPQHHRIDGNEDGDFLDREDIYVGEWEYMEPEEVVKSYTISRTLSVWTLDSYMIQGFDLGSITNEALPSGSLKTEGVKDVASVQVTQSSWESLVIDPSLEGLIEVNLGTEIYGNQEWFPALPSPDWSMIAESKVDQFIVRNDLLSFNGMTIMDAATYIGVTPAPIAIPNGAVNQVIFENGLVIPETQENGTYSSSGTVDYELVAGIGSVVSSDISGLENVVVHTPVVAYPTLDIISRESQAYEQLVTEKQLVIEETFQINYPTSGQHIDAVGYGNRDYASYINMRQINFPFDVYLGEDYKGIYLENNQWHTVSEDISTFFVPAWSAEQEGLLKFRTIPLNIPDMSSQAFEFNANLSVANYKAVETVEFNLSGKMMGFTVNNCYDDIWQKHFETNRMYAGTQAPNLNIEIEEIGVQSDQILPVMPDKVVSEEEIFFVNEGELLDAVLLGYPIEYSLATNGDLYGEADYIIIHPTFEYVPFIEGVETSEPLIQRIDMSQRQAVDVYIDTNSQLEYFTGDVLLSEEERKFIGKTNIGPGSISEYMKQIAIQRWDGKFYLPNMSFFVPKGLDLSNINAIDVKKEPFLHNGYIIVNFEIYSMKSISDQVVHGITNNVPSFDQDILNTILFAGYEPESIYGKGWELEGYQLEQLGLELKRGDVIFYSTDKRASHTYY